MISVAPPLSAIDALDNSIDTTGRGSSSAMIRLCAVPAAATSMVLSHPNSLLSTAVMVTVPVLSVCPSKIVSADPLSMKSAATAGATGVADTAMTVCSFSGALSRADTTLCPPFSLMFCGLRTSSSAFASGGSFSSMVRRTGTGFDASPEIVDAVTSTGLFHGLYCVSSRAVMVTDPELSVCPAAIVRVVPLCTKSPATAGATGSVLTFRMLSSLAA